MLKRVYNTKYETEIEKKLNREKILDTSILIEAN